MRFDRFAPQPESARECVVVATAAYAFRGLLDEFGIAAANDSSKLDDRRSTAARTMNGSRHDQRAPLRQGPVQANVMPGLWMLKNSQRPSGL
jgi:hypothetical protein